MKTANDYIAASTMLCANVAASWRLTFWAMAIQSREAILKLKVDTSSTFSVGKYSRLHCHVLYLVLFALLSLVALFTSVTVHVSGLSGGRSGVPGAEDDGRGRKLLPQSLHGSSIANDSAFLAFVMSEPDAEHEKNLIKEVLEEGSQEYSHRRHERGRAARRPSRLPSPYYAPFWPQFRALLRAWVAMKWYDPKVMQSLVAMIKEPIDRHHRHQSQLLRPATSSSSTAAAEHHPPSVQTRLYASCAVVGNSGILLNSTYGEAIDAHEAVIRLNNARVKEFEKHVGKKTTIAFMNSNILHKCARRVRCYCQSYGEDDVPIVIYISQVQHLMDMAMCGPVHAAPLLVTDPRFDALTARIAKWYSVGAFVERTGIQQGVSEWSAVYSGVQGFHYSSGMQAVMLALGICEEVDLYGFGKANGTKHHYHTAQPKELHIHDYAAEYIFYDELVMASRSGINNIAIIPFLRDAGIRLPRVRVFGFRHQIVSTARRS